MFVVPLIIGIWGLKTDRLSLIVFCIVYLVSLFTLLQLEWKIRDYFYPCVFFATLAYFLTHIYINGGILTVKRSKQTMGEQLWIPSWRGTLSSLKSWLLAPLQLPKIAARKIAMTPTRSLSFSMVIFALYTFSSIMTGGRGDAGLPNFMAGVHFIGITLCIGLMLEGIWPVRLKPYFALYWFFTLFYCLNFGSMLAFLRSADTTAFSIWLAGLILLAGLVDSTSFITMLLSGGGLAVILWSIVLGMPIDAFHSIGLTEGLLFCALLITVLVFSRNKEAHTRGKLYLNEVFSRAVSHESRQPLTEIAFLSRMHGNAVHDSVPMQNANGEKGFWMPDSKHGMMEEFGQKIGRAVQEVEREFSRFNQLIGKEISTLDKEKVSMRSLIEAIVPTLPKKYRERIKIHVEATQDFEPMLIRPLFANVIANLLKNAYLHGNAKEMKIDIQGTQNKLSIRDNGRGISSAILPHIFDFGFTTREQLSGGVGLALAKIIVEASGGKISCTSRHGDKDSFTEFVMEFPRE